MFLPNVAKSGVLFQLFQDWVAGVTICKSPRPRRTSESGLGGLKPLS